MILVTPQSWEVYKISGVILHSLFGGEHSTISLHPAICAGTASINTVENNGAEPPGIYSPTFSIGRFSCQQVTPLVVSKLILLVFCALWNAKMFSLAKSIALFNASETRFFAASISWASTIHEFNFTPSNRSV